MSFAVEIFSVYAKATQATAIHRDPAGGREYQATTTWATAHVAQNEVGRPEMS